MKIQPIAPNQTVLTLAKGTRVLFSYETPVAAEIPGRGYVRADRKYSNTTINGWVGACCETVPQSEIAALVP